MHRFSAPVDLPALRRALAHVVERHETLRTGFATDVAGEPSQWVAPSAPVELAAADLTDTAPEEREAALHRRVAAQDAAAFDLAEPPSTRRTTHGLPAQRWSSGPERTRGPTSCSSGGSSIR